MPFWERKPSEFDVSQDKAIKALIQNVNALNKADQTFWQWIQHLNNRISNHEAAIQNLQETINKLIENRSSHERNRQETSKRFNRCCEGEG